MDTYGNHTTYIILWKFWNILPTDSRFSQRMVQKPRRQVDELSNQQEFQLRRQISPFP